MAVELPEPLQWVLLLLAGTRWPEADEGQLRDMADHWRKAATQLQDASHAADAAVKQALDGQQGAAADALAKHWADYSVGKGTEQDPGYLPGTIAACNGMGDMLEGMANSAETAKIQIIAQLGILAFELATAEAEAVPTLGASMLEVPVFITVSRETVVQVLKRLLKEALEHAIKQAVQMAAINLMAQTIELAQGHRKSIDMKELGQNALGGAVAGATGHLLGKGVGAAGEKLGLGHAMETTAGKMVTGAGVGVGTDAATQLITTGHVDSGSLLGSGLSGAGGVGLHAGAAAAKAHFNEAPKMPPEGALGGGGAGGDHSAPPTFTPSTSTDHASGGSGDSYHGPGTDTASPDHAGSDSPTTTDTSTPTGGTGLTPFGSNRPSAGGSSGGSSHESPASAPAPEPASAGHAPAEGSSGAGAGAGGEGHGSGEEKLQYLNTGDRTVYPDGTTGLSSHEGSAPAPESAPTHEGETLRPAGDALPLHNGEAIPAHEVPFGETSRPDSSGQGVPLHNGEAIPGHEVPFGETSRPDSSGQGVPLHNGEAIPGHEVP
ncbi:hypothetical protein, partial [Kitasatospora sp. MAP5-34]|uniref:WXG100-like domain-containing protein n=1 Tax=Kitasatospora sp. MAP5-34 TaxID=3035102 RepID=UPI002474E805